MQERIIYSIYTAVDQINQNMDGAGLAKTLETELFGNKEQLDSLGLINLVVAIEDSIEREFGVPITLADDRALSQEVSPFRTIGTLVAYVEVLLREKVEERIGA